MGNITATVRKRNAPAYYKIVDIAGSNSYATNGESYTNAQFECNGQIDAITDGGNAGATGYTIYADIPNKKIKFFKGGVEETAGVNLTAAVARVVVYADNPY